MSLITIDCHSPSSPPTRRLMILPFQIPSTLYPLALLAFFSVLLGPRLDFLVSILTGYAHVHGYLDTVKASDATVRRVEGALLGWAGAAPAGFVLVDDASGGVSLPVSVQSPGGGGTRAAPPSGGGGWSLPSAVASPSFPTSSGRAVGSFGGVPPAPAPSAEDPSAARDAARKAAERRAASALNDN